MWFTKKKIKVALGILTVVVIGCSAKMGGELIGVQGRGSNQQEVPPFGMVLIPQGTFNMGLNDQDALSSMNAPTTVASVDAFWIDQTEITNNEYRQFVNYVCDSITRTIMGEGEGSEFVIAASDESGDAPIPRINWDTKIDPKKHAELIKKVEEELYAKTPMGRQLNISKLKYGYAWVDYMKVIGRGRKSSADTSPIIREIVNVYPDTLVWLRDFDYSYNEPFALRYYNHPAYDDYPVVGVTWRQATAFCHWRTNLMRDFCSKNRRFIPHDYRLPSEAEWEYAARGGMDQQMYPWGGPYTYNKTGCFLANFQPQRSRFGIDGGTKTLPVGSYQPNDYGLFDMAGNVAEWTASAFDEQSYNFVNAINPDYRYSAQGDSPLAMTRKTIKGGSWKDIAYFLQCGARTFEYQDSAKSYIGFRCVRSYLGR